jgi:hypothetical protein
MSKTRKRAGVAAGRQEAVTRQADDFGVLLDPSCDLLVSIQPLAGHLEAPRWALNELKAESLVITVPHEMTEPKKKMPFHPLRKQLPPEISEAISNRKRSRRMLLLFPAVGAIPPVGLDRFAAGDAGVHLDRLPLRSSVPDQPDNPQGQESQYTQREQSAEETGDETPQEAAKRHQSPAHHAVAAHANPGPACIPITERTRRLSGLRRLPRTG